MNGGGDKQPVPFSNITMRFAYLQLAAFIILTSLASPARAFSDAELIDGFHRTVFGSEYQSFGWHSRLVKKFGGPVRFYIDDRSAERRGGDVLAFVMSLPALIEGIEVELAPDPDSANYRIFVLDRSDYQSVIAGEIYNRPATRGSAPGRCLVRVISTMSGITRSDAVIVADEGDFLFNRCMIEEVLQGLGPVNDDRSLTASVFNDRSRHASFTPFDRHILNMLYHPLILPGMTKLEVDLVLPTIAAEVRERLAATTIP
jgi:hypothetical protein